MPSYSHWSLDVVFEIRSEGAKRIYFCSETMFFPLFHHVAKTSQEVRAIYFILIIQVSFFTKHIVLYFVPSYDFLFIINAEIATPDFSYSGCT